MFTHQRYTHMGVDLKNPEVVRERLLMEIAGLQRRLHELKGADAASDYATRNTYVEMIHSRRELAQRLRGTRPQ